MRIARIEIARIDGTSDGDDSIGLDIWRYPSATISGGSTLSVVPLRQGAPATTAAARGGASNLVTGSGQLQLAAIPMVGGGSATYEFPFDCTLSPGAVLYLDGRTSYFSANTLVDNISALISVYFEELRLAWHY